MKEENQKDDVGSKTDAFLSGNAPMRIRIEQSVLNKDVTMRVMENGMLFVQAPLSVTKDAVIRVIEKNRDWIQRRLVRLGLRPEEVPSWKPLTEESLFKRFNPKYEDATADWIIASMPWGEVLFKVNNCGKGWVMKMSVEGDGSVLLTVPKTFSVADVVAFIKMQTAIVRRGIEERLNKRLVDLPDWRPVPLEVLALRSILSAQDAAVDEESEPEAPQQEEPRGVGPGPLPDSGYVEAKVKGRKVLIAFRKHNTQIYVSLRRLKGGKCVFHVPKVMTRERLRHYISEHEDEVAECLRETKEKAK